MVCGIRVGVWGLTSSVYVRFVLRHFNPILQVLRPEPTVATTRLMPLLCYEAAKCP